MGKGLVWLIGAYYACWQQTADKYSVMRAMGAATCAQVLQSLPISHHFHGCTALLVLRFVVVKWCYIKYLALPFFLPTTLNISHIRWFNGREPGLASFSVDSPTPNIFFNTNSPCLSQTREGTEVKRKTSGGKKRSMRDNW